MQITRKLVITALCASAVPTVIVFAAPDLIVVGLFLLILPGLILSLWPTVFFYQLIISCLWLAYERKGSLLAVCIGIIAAMTVAFGIPDRYNAITSERQAAALAKNSQPPEKLSKVRSLSIQTQNDAKRLHCGYLCQLLLHNGAAREVILLPVKKEEQALSLRLSGEGPCADLETTDRILSKQGYQPIFSPSTHASIVQSLRFRIAAGSCLVAEPVDHPNPELQLRMVHEEIGKRSLKLQLLPEPVEINGIEIESPGKWIARQTLVHAGRLQSPLHLEPRHGSELKVSGFEWGRNAPQSTTPNGIELLEMLTAFDLKLPPPPTPDEIRDQLDEILESTSLPASSFSLSQAYRPVIERSPEHEDFKRLSRMIADPRFTDFDILRAVTSKSDSRVLRDPILRRLQVLVASPDRTYEKLESIAAMLPRGIYESSPLLDLLLEDRANRRRSPNLLKRLSDRGPAGAGKLLQIVDQSLTTQDKQFDSRKEFEAAIEALCRLGPEAKHVLPDLLRLHYRYEKGRFTESHAWRGALVAIGADPAQFHPRGSVNQDAYEKSLRQQAKHCRN